MKIDEVQSKPIVVLRPTAVERNKDSIYTIKKDILLPTVENIKKLIDCLNDDMNIVKLSHHYLSPILRTRIGLINIENCETQAQNIGCNIIGAIFLDFLRCYGFSSFQIIGEMTICSEDAGFLSFFYPLLIKYLDNKSHGVNDAYTRGVTEDIIGQYKIIEICGGVTNIDDDLKFMVFLKQAYRHTVRENVPAFAPNIKCNLIHTADNTTDLNENIKIFLEKKYLFNNLN